MHGGDDGPCDRWCRIWWQQLDGRRERERDERRRGRAVGRARDAERGPARGRRELYRRAHWWIESVDGRLTPRRSERERAARQHGREPGLARPARRRDRYIRHEARLRLWRHQPRALRTSWPADRIAAAGLRQALAQRDTDLIERSGVTRSVLFCLPTGCRALREVLMSAFERGRSCGFGAGELAASERDGDLRQRDVPDGRVRIDARRLARRRDRILTLRCVGASTARDRAREVEPVHRLVRLPPRS